MGAYRMNQDWVESFEVYGEWAAQAIEQARADEDWREWMEAA